MLLGMTRFQRIPDITRRYYGLLGALAPLRVVNKFFELFTGHNVCLMEIVRAMRWLGSRIRLQVSRKGTNVFEADGTGVPVNSARKRGKELEILAQRKTGGGIRVAGMTLGRYKQGWKHLFAPLKRALKRFKRIILVTDGDISPLKGLEGVEVILQRCLFHIPHEVKYTLWQDGVSRKSARWNEIMSRILVITNIKRIREHKKILEKILRRHRYLLRDLIGYCHGLGLGHTTSFLQAAADDIYGGVERKMFGGTTSLIERLMRTLNQRINIAQWSDESVLAVAKIRAAYYYNGLKV
jgi:hypothetical protein